MVIIDGLPFDFLIIIPPFVFGVTSILIISEQQFKLDNAYVKAYN